MKIIFISNLFPNSKEPTRGIFSKQIIAELKCICEVRVVAPVPWHQRQGVPLSETIDGIQIYHPPYFMIPKIGRFLYGLAFFLSLVRFIKKMQRTFDFDVILAKWAYPDGVGSLYIGKLLKKRVVIYACGSDINYHTQYFLRKWIIADALRRADKIISVSDALKKRMVAIGVPESRIFVNANGINVSLFHPMSRDDCRTRLGLDMKSKLILFVGNLVPVKGVNYLIDAFARMTRDKADMKLVIVGKGSFKVSLEGLAAKLGVKDNVLFHGKKMHEQIPYYMNACDVLCLPSLNEGCPNVVLEALACGRPVVASRVGGIPDIILSDKHGVLVEPQNPDALESGLKKVLSSERDEQFAQEGYAPISWAASTKRLFEQIEMVMTNA